MSNNDHNNNGADDWLLKPCVDRFMIFPIKYTDLWKLYKKAQGGLWTAEEIDLSSDLKDWNELTPNEQHFIEYILAFFSAADGIVSENLAERFYVEVQVPEVRAFYASQMYVETIHAETYALLIDTYISDIQKRNQLQQAIITLPAVQKKANWALRNINAQEPFAKRLLAFACIEGIMFSGSFCAIFWLKKRGKMAGLTFSNELISRDEGLHCQFAVTLYSMLHNKLTQSQVYEVVQEAVTHEKEFITEALPVNLIGMNSVLMKQYIEYVADYWLVQLGYEKLYKSTNPFDWMNLLSLTSETNFFEKRVSEYQKSDLMKNSANNLKKQQQQSSSSSSSSSSTTLNDVQQTLQNILSSVANKTEFQLDF